MSSYKISKNHTLSYDFENVHILTIGGHIFQHMEKAVLYWERII